MTGGGGGGGGGGSDGASYCKPKKIHKPEILDPKKYLALKFPTQKQDYKCTLYCLLNINSFFSEHRSLKRSSNEYFSRTLIATETRNKKFARSEDPKKKRVFF